jgi:hypothetical protein
MVVVLTATIFIELDIENLRVGEGAGLGDGSQANEISLKPKAKKRHPI